MSKFKDLLRRVPGLVRLWRIAGRIRHALVLRFARRRNYTFTQFCRLPTQIEEVVGPVLEATNAGAAGSHIHVLLFGSSIGAEPYSLASALFAQRPGVRWDISCYDIEPEMVDIARTGRYAVKEVALQRGIPPGFVTRTFDRTGEDFVVKPEIRKRVQFHVGNILDVRLIRSLDLADLVVAQNLLYHLSRADATRAFHNLFQLLKPRGALAVDGADLDLRAALTEDAGLVPWRENVERIHNEARVERGYAWPRIYWGLEPYDGQRRDAERRYATIFLRPLTTGGHL